MRDWSMQLLMGVLGGKISMDLEYGLEQDAQLIGIVRSVKSRNVFEKTKYFFLSGGTIKSEWQRCGCHSKI